MLNYVFGVDWEDFFRFQLDQTSSTSTTSTTTKEIGDYVTGGHQEKIRRKAVLNVVLISGLEKELETNETVVLNLFMGIWPSLIRLQGLVGPERVVDGAAVHQHYNE